MCWRSETGQIQGQGILSCLYNYTETTSSELVKSSKRREAMSSSRVTTTSCIPSPAPRTASSLGNKINRRLQIQQRRELTRCYTILEHAPSPRPNKTWLWCVAEILPTQDRTGFDWNDDLQDTRSPGSTKFHPRSPGRPWGRGICDMTGVGTRNTTPQ